MKKMVINVACNIGNPLYDLIIKSSLAIKKRYDSDWYIDDKKYYLHLSFYLFAAPEKNKGKVVAACKKFYEYLKQTNLETIDLVSGKDGPVMLEFKKTPRLYDFHKKALEIFNPPRENYLRDKYESKKHFNSLKKWEQKNLLKYGHIYVLNKYHPHVTIARLKSEKDSRQVVKGYKKKLIGQKSTLDRLQVHQAFFGTDDRNVLIFDKRLIK